ncbi:MAG TPA: DNA polymerase/3'-5' exonuclease PolX [Chthoniobacterales bacterium]|nr:DNA polymerase/3'-5' exonuclease PolX [Chthoniobacterales bacterium]
MPVHNSEIAEMFEEVADLLEIEGANEFRIRAYRNASRVVAGLSRNAADLVADEKALTELPGIGKDLAGKIAEICRTGKFSVLEECRSRASPGIRMLLRIPGLGAKRIRVLCDELKITGLEDLRKAADGGKLEGIHGFGPKIVQKILAEATGLTGETRTKLIVAEEIANSLVDWLRSTRSVSQIELAGSLRRRRETVGDLDILATCEDSHEVMNRFVNYEEVKEVVSHGSTRSSLKLRSGINADLRVVPDESFGAALHYFTGSKPHNIAVRTLGVKRGLKINEYGIFKGKKQIGGRTEREIYAQVGLPYIEPELREDRGEIDAAREGRLPRLVTLKDIRGNLHCHTTDSDGRYSIEEMAEAARERGHEYLAITEHSQRVAMVRGLDTKRLRQQMRRIDKLNEQLKGIRLLKSCEVDILEDGSLDLPDGVLGELDLVVCSIHSKLNLPAEKQTERIIRAMDNPHFNIFAHPTGRLIGRRAPYKFDIERVLKAAYQRGCMIEINAQPDRLDLPDVHCKTGKEIGVKFAISTDAHSIADLDLMRFGVDQARRGWLEPKDVVNTRSWPELQKSLKRRQ